MIRRLLAASLLLLAVSTPSLAQTVSTPIDQAKTMTAGGPTTGSFWHDNRPGDAKITRVRDRLLIGAAADLSGNIAPPTGAAVAQYSTNGASWMLRDGAVVSISPNGLSGVVGFSRTSDGASTGFSASSRAAIGVAAAVIGNTTTAPSWGMYSDVQLEADAAGYGIEVAGKNKSINKTSYPYSLTTGVIGVWLAGGGDASYGGSPTNPSNAAIQIGKNASTWNVGIVFDAAGLTGTDGSTGTGIAIDMAKGHVINWRGPSNIQGALITSSVTTSGQDTRLTFANNQVALGGANGAAIVSAEHTASAVNYLRIRNATTGNRVSLLAGGTDTNIDLLIGGKGTASVVSNSTIKPASNGTLNLGQTGATWGVGYVSTIITSARVVTAGASTTVTGTDTLIVIRKATGSATGVTLPASPAAGRTIVIKDGKGDAATNNITITPAAGTIDGAATLVISANRGIARLVYDGTEWVVQ